MAAFYPTADWVLFYVVSWNGSQPTWSSLDSDSSTYIQGDGGYAQGSWVLADTTAAADEFVSVTVEFDCRPTPGFQYPTVTPVEGTLVDELGNVHARSLWTWGGSMSFTGAAVVFGSVIPAPLANSLKLFLRGANQKPSDSWQANDARMIVDDEFVGPITTVTGPTGVIGDNTPTIQWSAVIDDAATETESHYRIRLFTAAQYGAGGFNPATSAATYDTGPRALAGSHAVTLPNHGDLPAGTYRAYVSAGQTINPGVPWVWVYDPGANNGEGVYLNFPALQWGPYAFTSFVIVSPPGNPTGPTIGIDVVRDLTEVQRTFLSAPHVPLIRVSLYAWDGAYIRDLNVTAGAVTLDAAAQVRGKTTFTCTDTDLVPITRTDALGDLAPLHPFGSYVHIARGLATGGSSTVLVGLGVFRLKTVKRSRLSGQVQVTGEDFAMNLLESRFAYPVTRQSWDTVPPTPDTKLVVAKAIINEAGLAWKNTTADTSQVVANYTNDLNAERPKALDGLIQSIDGWTWYFDIDGICYLGLGPDITTDPIAYTFADGDGTTALAPQIVDRDQTLSRTEVFDVAVAYDQAKLVIGGAYDANSESIIARWAANPAILSAGAGPFSPGGRPFFYSSPAITDLAGAQAAARTRLGNVAFPAEAITAEGVPIPDLRPDKIIAMPRAGDSTLARWQVVKVVMPLTVAGAMTFDALTPADDVVAAS